MPIDLRAALVEATRLTPAQKGNDHLRERLTITPNMGYHPGAFHLSFHESEQMRKDYTDKMMEYYGFSRETAEKLRSDEIYAMGYGVGWGNLRGSFSGKVVVPLSDEQIEPENAGSCGDMPVLFGIIPPEIASEILESFVNNINDHRVCAHGEVVKHAGRVKKSRRQHDISISCVGILGYCRGYRVVRDEFGNLRVFRIEMTLEHICRQAFKSFLNLFRSHKQNTPRDF